MIYLSGHHHADVAMHAFDWPIGLCVTPRAGYRPERVAGYRWWAADNGCFAGAFDAEGYEAWLGRMFDQRRSCLFATAPDVLGDAVATISRSRPWLEVIRRNRYPVALVAQDGLSADSFGLYTVTAPLPTYLEGLRAVAGHRRGVHRRLETRWKLSYAATEVAHYAKRAGKWVHMGRVNSLRRLQAAVLMGCDSADGTLLRYGRDINLPKLVRALGRLEAEPFLDLAGVRA